MTNHQPKITYASQIRTLESRMSAMKQQIEAENDSIEAAKRPVSLILAFLSAPVRQAALQEVYKSRGRIALLEQDLVLAGYQKQELERLQMTFPEYDNLIDRSGHLQYRSWDLSLQEDEFDLDDRESKIFDRLEEKRIAQEERNIQLKAEELAKRQRELNRQQDEVNKRQAALKKKKAAKETKDKDTSSH